MIAYYKASVTHSFPNFTLRPFIPFTAAQSRSALFWSFVAKNWNCNNRLQSVTMDKTPSWKSALNVFQGKTVLWKDCHRVRFKLRGK